MTGESDKISVILSEIKAIREENSYYKTVCEQLWKRPIIWKKK